MNEARQWRDSVLLTAAVFSGLVAVAALAGSVTLGRRASDLRSEIPRLIVRVSAAASGSGADHSLRPDFTQWLSRAPVAAPLLEEFRRAASEAGVTLSFMSTEARTPTERTLGRLQIAVVLRGSYPAAKATMAQVASRFPNLVYQRVSVRRLAMPTDVEARVDLMLPAPPERRAGDSLPVN